jgi:hypothetical protein
MPTRTKSLPISVDLHAKLCAHIEATGRSVRDWDGALTDLTREIVVAYLNSPERHIKELNQEVRNLKANLDSVRSQVKKAN